MKILILIALSFAAITTCVTFAQEAPDTSDKKINYSPYTEPDYPIRPLFGDQHLHTSWSADAIAGGTRVTPEQAFRFARGEEVISTTGVPAKLSRPFDWLAVSDHSDGMGFMNDVLSGKPELMTDPILKEWSTKMNGTYYVTEI